MIGPPLALTVCLEAKKTALPSGNLVVSLACKRFSRQHLEHGEYTNQRQNTHLYTGCGNKWDVAPQVQGKPSALGC